VDTCKADGFQRGHWITGAYALASGAQGNQLNNYRELISTRCKYGLYLEPGDGSTNLQGARSATVVAGGSGYSVGDLITLAGGTFATRAVLRVATLGPGDAVATVTVSTDGAYTATPSNPVAQASVSPTGGSGATFNVDWYMRTGWCNENNFWGGRTILATSDPENCDAVHIQWTKVGSPPVPEKHECNNNRFYGVTLEGAWGRKVFCEGRYNAWIACRWEHEKSELVPPPQDITDIEFAETNAGGGRDNLLFYGFDLHKQVVVGPTPASPTFQDFNRRFDILTNPDSAIYGDGSDGPLVLDSGTQTMPPRDMYYSSVTIAAGATLKTNGHRLFCFSLTNAGTISNAGGNGTDAAGATAGAGGAGAPAGTVGGSSSGTSGVSGVVGSGSTASGRLFRWVFAM
jgi:hypothetical protein